MGIIYVDDKWGVSRALSTSTVFGKFSGSVFTRGRSPI